MRVEEFRIGNYYKWYADGKEYYFKVDNSFFGDINVINNAEPIELTEEILLKCGFVRDGNTDYYTCRKVGFTINLSGTIGYRTCIWSNEHIKYLHQLQNLYFALCNEELNIQL